MIYIEDNKIYITRGDDGTIVLTIQDKGKVKYSMQEGDKLTLSVREIPDTDSEILLQTTSETNTLVLTHDDTKKIPAGKYSCDIQLTKQNGDIITVFPSNVEGNTRNYKNFIVGGEVT